MHILIVKLSSLGDVVHALPAAQDIRSAHPSATIDWVVEPGFAPVLQRVDGLTRIIDCPLRRWRRTWWHRSVRAEWRRFVGELRARRYDAVLDLQGLTKSAVVARLADGPRHGLANATEGSSFEAPARWLTDHPIAVEPHIDAIERSRVLAAAALGHAHAGAPRFGLRGRTCPSADAPRTLVMVHGTSRADKLWPESSWTAVGRRAVASGWHVALPHSGTMERARADRIARGIGSGADVWPELALDAVIDRMALTQGVIGVDSGLSHIAVALGLPHVQVYTLPTAWRTGPQPTPGRTLQVAVEVAPGEAGVAAVWDAWGTVSSASASPGNADRLP